MSIYNFLFLCHHNLDSIVFRIQFLVVKKLNQNIMMGNLPFSFKQTYQVNSIYPFFPPLQNLSRTKCSLDSYYKFVMRNENIPNFIIMLSPDILSINIGTHFLSSLSLGALFIWSSDLL
jgi:hypothetical protein